MSKKKYSSGHTEADKALWLVYVMQYTADIIEKPIVETARLLDRHGFVKKILDGYDVFHTQGFEYMAELLASELSQAQNV